MAKAKRPADGRGEWVAAAEAKRPEKRTVKTGVYLTEDGAKRLRTAALVLGMDFSLIVDALLCHYLVGFYSGWRSGEAAEDVPMEEAA